MRAGILGPREVFFLCSRGAVQEALLFVWAVGADCDSKPFVLPFYTPPSGSWCNLWSLMAMRLKGLGMTSTNFFRTIVSYGHEVDGSRHEFDQFFKVFVRRFPLPTAWTKVMAWVELMAWVSPIAGEDSTSQGLSFLFFCRSHAMSLPHGMIPTYGQSQSHGMSRTHGMSFTNCRRG